MHLRWSLVLFVVATCGALVDEAPEVLFAKAHAQSSKGNFKEALRIYEKISPKGHDVYFNMGVAAFGAREYGRALLSWRRAEKFPNWLERLKLVGNISCVTEALKQRPVADGVWMTLAYVRWWAGTLGRSLLVSLPLLPLQIAFLLLWFLAAFFFKNRQFRPNAAMILFLLTTIFGGLLFARFVADSHVWGVVICKSASLRSGPGKDYPVIGTLPEGREVLIKVTDRNFLKVKNGRFSGWVERGAASIV